MRFVSALALFISLLAFADRIENGLPEDSAFTPGVQVSVTPYDGVIPATMANGRPVYKFSVLVLDRNKKLGASSSTLLQAGMHRELKHQRSRRGWLEGSVRIDRTGLTSYRFAFVHDERVMFSLSGVVQVRPE
jgi:hypothetical protein